MKKTVLALAVLALLATATMNANAVTVKDAPSCADWNPNADAHKIWIEGFLSGIAMERDADFLDKVSLKKIVNWVNAYCKANPKGEVTVAGIELSLELMKRNSPSTR